MTVVESHSRLGDQSIDQSIPKENSPNLEQLWKNAPLKYKKV